MAPGVSVAQHTALHPVRRSLASSMQHFAWPCPPCTARGPSWLPEKAYMWIATPSRCTVSWREKPLVPPPPCRWAPATPSRHLRGGAAAPLPPRVPRVHACPVATVHWGEGGARPRHAHECARRHLPTPRPRPLPVGRAPPPVGANTAELVRCGDSGRRGRRACQRRPSPRATPPCSRGWRGALQCGG